MQSVETSKTRKDVADVYFSESSVGVTFGVTWWACALCRDMAAKAALSNFIFSSQPLNPLWQLRMQHRSRAPLQSNKGYLGSQKLLVSSTSERFLYQKSCSTFPEKCHLDIYICTSQTAKLETWRVTSEPTSTSVVPSKPGYPG